MKYISAAFGLIITAFSGFMLWHIMQGATVDRHLVYLFAGGVGFGMLLIIPTVVVGSLKALLDVIGQYLPQVVIGGRRAADPPVSAAAPATAAVVSPGPNPEPHPDGSAAPSIAGGNEQVDIG